MPSRRVAEHVTVTAPELAEIPIQALAESPQQARDDVIRSLRLREHARHRELRLESPLHLAARRDVADEAEGEQPLVGLDVAQADLDRKLAPVLPDGRELEPQAHGAHSGIEEKAFAVSSVARVKPLGHERLEGRAVELAPVVAQHLLQA